jgi:hypothetical protein
LAPKRRLRVTLLAMLALAFGGVAATNAAMLGLAAKRKPAHHKSKPKVTNGLKAPGLISPADGVFVQTVPTMTWGAVKGALEYEWQVSAESSFRSQIVQRSGGQGTPRTRNLAAALSESVTDGTYYWRVRGVTAGGRAGSWSSPRTFVKHWTQTASLLEPADTASIQWPSKPLVLRWSVVPHAYEYLVQVATDREFANVVYGSTRSLVKTTGTALALPVTLPAGRYYWRVTPVDDEAHRGVPSESRSFVWSWPTRMSSKYVTNVNPNFGTYEPQFNWEAVPGAARYEVQVSSAEGFPTGSMWCCEKEAETAGTALSPTAELNNNNEYYWRVRALDPAGNAGEWNEGELFKKNFDEVTPSVPGLKIIDASGDEQMPPGPGQPVETDEPIVTWSVVPGASSYEVQVTPYESECNWLSKASSSAETATLGWAPLVTLPRVGPAEWPVQQTPDRPGLKPGVAYCVRVLARAGTDATGNKVISRWAYVGGEGNPAFRYLAQPAPGLPEVPFSTKAGAYGLPNQAAGAGVTVDSECLDAQRRCVRTPLFTWSRVPGAVAYYVVIARDRNFTNVVDVAATEVPAYAPPLHGSEPLDDETESYYWAVIPVKVNAHKELEGSAEPLDNAPQSFNKSSTAPQPLAPAGVVENQPTFGWSPVEGAFNYTLQVSQNSTFKTLLDEVRTASTAFTSAKTYPAGEPLYWRVRANDANLNASLSGLNWSEARQFTRVLGTPVLSPSNPTSTIAIPVFSWLAVPGAVAYEVSVEQPDGTRKEFTVDSTSFTPTEWDGPGVWRFKVRALFPGNGALTVPGPFTPQQSLVHGAAAPPGAVGEKSGTKVVIHWEPQPYAKQYQVAISTSETFRNTIESKRVHTDSWAPNVNFSTASNRGTLYWRVAAVDGKGDAGSYSTGQFVPPKPKPKCVVKKVKRDKRTVKVCVVPKHPKKSAEKKH